jgi:hypothetical protein
MDRRDPDRSDAKFQEMIETGPDAGEVADAVAGRGLNPLLPLVSSGHDEG